MTADWYIDFISPYPYLQLARFDELPADLEVTIKPVLFAGLLGHWGHKGPAEIPAKRLQTYRYVQWLAARRGLAWKMPPRHPFNPLGVLRLAIAAGPTRETVEAIYRFVWSEGRDPQDETELLALARVLRVDDAAARLQSSEVKQALRANTDEAIARGVYGVPTFAVGDELFWGDDATGMLLHYLADPQMFTSGEMARIAALPVGASRAPR